MIGTLYPKGLENILNGTVSIVNGTVKAVLMKETFVFDSSDENYVNTHECDDIDYAGEQTLAVTASEITVDDNTIIISTTNTVTTFTVSGTISGHYCVLYIEDGIHQKYFAFFDFGGEKSSENDEFKINWGAKDNKVGQIAEVTISSM